MGQLIFTDRTSPPCADAVVKAGIKTVVAAMQDPNPLVSGRGFRKLRAAGIEVIKGVLENEARLLNRHFIKFMTTGTPWVIQKLAATADGKLAEVAKDLGGADGSHGSSIAHLF